VPRTPNTPTPRLRLQILLSVLAFSTLFVGFSSNLWKASDADLFQGAGLFEGAVVGRLIISEREGITSYGGLPGWAIPTDREAYEADPRQSQYNTYLKGLDIVRFVPYYSQIGGQAIFFSLLDVISPLDKSLNIQVFKVMTSAFFALVMTLFVVWIAVEFGYFTSLVTLASVILSPCLTAYGRNLWFIPAAFFLPMIAIILMFHLGREERWQLGVIDIFVFLAVLAKLVLNGFEFISASLLMMFVPLAYFGIARKIEWRRLLKHVVTWSISATLAVVVVLAVLSVQHALVTGSARSSIDHLVKSFEKRTMSTKYNSRFSPEINEGLQAELLTVVKIYWKKDVISREWMSHIPVIWRFQRIVYGTAVKIFLLCSLFTLISAKYLGKFRDDKESTKDLALNVAFLVSFIPTFSWYVLFKAHAHMHLDLDTLAWHMPLMLFGTILLARTVESLASIVWRISWSPS